MEIIDPITNSNAFRAVPREVAELTIDVPSGKVGGRDLTDVETNVVDKIERLKSDWQEISDLRTEAREINRGAKLETDASVEFTAAFADYYQLKRQIDHLKDFSKIGSQDANVRIQEALVKAVQMERLLSEILFNRRVMELEVNLQQIDDTFRRGDSSDKSIPQRLKTLSKTKSSTVFTLLRELLESKDAYWVELGVRNIAYFKESITEKEFLLIRSILRSHDDDNLKISAATFLGFNDPKASDFLIDEINNGNSKYVNSAIVASYLTSMSIPPYISLSIADQITSDKVKNNKLEIEAAIRSVLSHN